MAFARSGLTVVGGSKKGAAPKMWLYKTADVVTTVDGAGYFDNGATTNTGMRNEMSVGDLVYVHANSAGTTPTYGLMIVTQITAAGIIDVTNATALGATDSD
jgi:hypothetical protein